MSITLQSTAFLSFLALSQVRTGLSLQASAGKNYLKVFYLKDGCEKAFCFVHLITGGIHRPSNRHSPDNHGARGYIFSQDLGMECVTPEGIKKLKVGKPLGFKHAMVIPRPNARKNMVDGPMEPYMRVRVTT